MKTLKEEAKEYAKELIEARVIEDHQSGWMESVYLYITRNSKWVQAEKIKAQIEVLQELLSADVNKINLQLIMLRLGIELKQLENESKTK
jgi:hypothetical protein